MTTLANLRTLAITRATTPAIVGGAGDRQGKLGFQEMDRKVDQLAGLLRGARLISGDRIVVLLPMCAELYITILALFRLGLTAVFFDPGLDTKLIDQRLAELRPTGIIAGRRAYLYCAARSGQCRRIAIRILLGGCIPGTVNWYQAYHLVPHRDYPAIDPDAPVLITLTSGSTGQAKVTVRTHAFLEIQYRVIQSNLAIRPGQTELVALPMFVLANLAAGATSVIPNADLRRPDRIQAAPVLRQIQKYSVTRILAPPAFLKRLLDHCCEENIQLPGVRELYTGGGPVFPALIRQCGHALPGAALHIIYGATEAEPIAVLDAAGIRPEDLSAMQSGRGILAGHPIRDIRCRVLADRWGEGYGPITVQQLEDLTLLAGQRGEIVVSGKHVLPDYPDEEANRTCKIHVGDTVWHRTGDAGYFDATGRLWLLGRCAASDRIVYPFEVEVPACEVPGVARAGFLVLGARRVLAVEMAPETPKASYPSIVRELQGLPVDEVVILNKIPLDRRHQSKVDQGALLNMLAPGLRKRGTEAGDH